MAIVHDQVCIDMLGSNLIDAATMGACIFECGAGRRTGRDLLAVRRVSQNIQVVCLAHVPLEQAIDGNGVVQEFVWELERHL
jgi:hypothetical protein